MRICSLMPGATEVVAALGLGESLVGISHECDYPASVRSTPVLLRSRIDPETLSGGEIDRRVHAAADRGESLYVLDEAALANASPDLVIMQDICDVCGITPAGIHEVLGRLPRRPAIVSLRAMTLNDVLGDIVRIGEAVGRADAARRLAAELRERLELLQNRIAGRPRPRVLCLEWLDPPYITGHWVPEMITWAGGASVLGEIGAVSHAITWDKVVAAQADIVVLAPCGFSVERTMREVGELARVPQWDRLRAMVRDRVFVVDAGAYLSRPGPRLVDGAELLAHLIHPDIFGPPLAAAARHLDRHAWSAP